MLTHSLLSKSLNMISMKQINNHLILHRKRKKGVLVKNQTGEITKPNLSPSPKPTDIPNILCRQVTSKGKGYDRIRHPVHTH